MLHHLLNSINIVILNIANLFQHTYTQIGGMFVGTGAFGCVYRPAFDYVVKINSNGIEEITDLQVLDGYISKIMKIHSSQIEVEQNELINKIDPEHLFTLPILKALEFDTDIWNTIEKSSEIKKCKLFGNKKHGSQLINIIVKDGGTTHRHLITNELTDMIYYLSTIDIIYSSFNPLFTGLKLMYSNDLVHHDIKSDNITFDGVRSYLIDFGISHTITSFINDQYYLELVEFHSRLFHSHENFEQLITYNTNSKSLLPIHYPPEYIITQLAFVENSDYIDLDVGLRIFKRSYPNFNDDEILTCLKSLRRLTDEYLSIIRDICKRGFIIYDMDYTYNQISDILKQYYLLADTDADDDEINDVVDGFFNRISTDPQVIDFIRKLYSKFDTFSLGRILYSVCSLDKRMIEQLDDRSIELKRKRIIINDHYMRFAKRMYCLDFDTRINVDELLSLTTHKM